MVNKGGVEKAIHDLILALGDDPNRPGLIETPKRVALMYEEILGGLSQNAREVIKYFDEDVGGQMIAVGDIPFHSVCEHHLLPFFGKVHVCYIPARGKLLGLSKIVRVVEMYARRLQLQERLGSQIADCLEKEAEAAGVMVKIQAEHMCITMRGIKKPGSRTVTMSLRGSLESDALLRKEAFWLIPTSATDCLV